MFVPKFFPYEYEKNVGLKILGKKKKARRLGVKKDEVELEAPSDDDEEDVEEPVTLYKILVEIDAR